MPRLFIGTIADKQEQKRTEQLLADLKSAEIKVTPVENLHMTWSFIGNVPQDSLGRISSSLIAAMNQIRELQLPPQMLFDSFEFWPDKIHPTLLVLTATETSSAIRNCARIIDHIVGPFKLDREAFPFRAHITLARLKKGAVSNNVSITALKSFLPFCLKLTDIGLFESVSTERQSVYRALARHEL